MSKTHFYEKAKDIETLNKLNVVGKIIQINWKTINKTISYVAVEPPNINMKWIDSSVYFYSLQFQKK